ncbi:MAG: hypothetical protein ACRCU9_07245, partial [Iodobacter sp.]
NKNSSSLLSDFITLRNGKYLYRSCDYDGLKYSLESLDRISGLLTLNDIKIKTNGLTVISSKDNISYRTLRMIERAIINGEVDGADYIEKLKNHGDYFFSLRERANSLIIQIYLNNYIKNFSM